MVTSVPRRAGLCAMFRWLLAAAMVATLSNPVIAEANRATDPSATSVLALQGLVDRVLDETGEVASHGAANVLDLQQALLNAIRSDLPGDEGPPLHQDDAVLPLQQRVPLPASPAPNRVAAPRLQTSTTAVTPPPAGSLPPDSGARVRYRFHLLCNAPPAGDGPRSPL